MKRQLADSVAHTIIEPNAAAPVHAADSMSDRHDGRDWRCYGYADSDYLHASSKRRKYLNAARSYEVVTPPALHRWSRGTSAQHAAAPRATAGVRRFTPPPRDYFTPRRCVEVAEPYPPGAPCFVDGRASMLVLPRLCGHPLENGYYAQPPSQPPHWFLSSHFPQHDERYPCVPSTSCEGHQSTSCRPPSRDARYGFGRQHARSPGTNSCESISTVYEYWPRAATTMSPDYGDGASRFCYAPRAASRDLRSRWCWEEYRASIQQLDDASPGPTSAHYREYSKSSANTVRRPAGVSPSSSSGASALDEATIAALEGHSLDTLLSAFPLFRLPVSAATVSLAVRLCSRVMLAMDQKQQRTSLSGPIIVGIFFTSLKLTESRRHLPSASWLGAWVNASKRSVAWAEMEVMSLLDWAPLRGWHLQRQP